MNMTRIKAVVMTLIAAVGGVLVGLGLADQGTITALTGSFDTLFGAAATIITTVAAIVAKYRT
jgi:phage-related protein